MCTRYHTLSPAVQLSKHSHETCSATSTPPHTHTPPPPPPPSRKQQILPVHPQASAINKVGCKIHRGHLSFGGCRNNTPSPTPQHTHTHTHTHTPCPCFAHSPHQNKIHRQKLKKQTLPITHRARHKSLTDCRSSHTCQKVISEVPDISISFFKQNEQLAASGFIMNGV